ncbi:Signal transduction histidine kinase [Sporobacter termitidis DSM 10068]|uniref:histidine kinase n=1 Tax=Sporobacter termitidis DSM 10068 TaxID=1123282 RepID=A0A1M5Y5N5_9FIRM|nr:HAMP domain-containing sensor histidine kinase [Sporobacter termitidis]SHI07390.1 Signal transduction histidine kinase [Sporobacter termitidis DSM 10068]
MSVFTNRDIKRLFIMLSCVFGAFIILSQLYILLADGSPTVVLFVLSLLLAAGVFGSCYLYFRRQQQMLDDAISQINLFVLGDTNARIESGSEGSLYKLFHEVNTLATTLNAHAVREQNTKDFLRNTISDISHQLKTPLAALAIYNSLLQDECEDKTAVCGFALKSEKEIERIETLVQNLLKITKLDAGSIFMDKHIENISDMMNDLKAHFEIRAEQENKEIILLGRDDEMLLCDRDWLIEAVSNIVKNALDHTDANSDIHIEWSRLPSVTQIIIKDNGSGVHPEDIHHIFKRFYRSRFSKDTQGVGLGLPLAKAIVEAHDGSIAVDSVLGNGSTFVLSFLNLTKL